MSTVADKLVQKRNSSGKKPVVKINDQEKDDKESNIASRVPFWGFLDLDNSTNFTLLILLRLVEACTLTWNGQHPDQYWQGT